MSKSVLHLFFYLFITGGTFIAAHFLIAYEIAHEPLRQGIHINGLVLIYSAISYVLYGIVTTVFFYKISSVSYLKGFLLMCLGMI
ncbi:MAG: hypothetical protein JNJ99_07895, partial [Crocinitomicaceae bacterium]|nr:hypothetical protein [Crocinitomicaceae bacterium]